MRILTGKTHLQIKLKRFRNLWTCAFDTLNQLFNYLYEALILKLDFQKNYVVSGKFAFFVIGAFSTPHSPFILTLLDFDRSVLYGNVGFSIVVRSAKNRYSSFWKKVSVFQKTCFKVKTLKTFKVSRDCHIKICQSRKWRAILKIAGTLF